MFVFFLNYRVHSNLHQWYTGLHFFEGRINNPFFNLSLYKWKRPPFWFIMTPCAPTSSISSLKWELCTATLNWRHRQIVMVFMISRKCVNFPCKLHNRFSNVPCFPLVVLMLLSNDAHPLSLPHAHTQTLSDSTLKLGLLEVCVWDRVLLVVKWSEHANRPIMYILSWHSAILKLEHCISAVVFWHFGAQFSRRMY